MITIAEIIIFVLVFSFVILMMVSIFVSIITCVPFVPTARKARKRMVELAELKPGEIVYDLGCGDGCLLIEAMKKERVQARGYEISPMVYLLAKLRVLCSGARGITIRLNDFFGISLRDADVIFCYLMPCTIERLAKKLERECKEGCRVIANSFQFKTWTPITVLPRDKEKGQPSLYRYEIGKSNTKKESEMEGTEGKSQKGQTAQPQTLVKG